MRRGAVTWGAISRFVGVVRRESPQIVQTWLHHADLLGLTSKIVARTPVVWNIRNSFHLGLSSWVTKVCALLSWVPATIVVNSNAGRQLYGRLGYRPRRWQLISNGFDLQVMRPDPVARKAVRVSLGVPAAAPLIGLVARLDPLKDHNTFLRAAGLLARTDPTVHFLLIGNGVVSSEPTLSGLVRQEGLEKRTYLLGERCDIPRLTAALDIASLSSYAEGFPNVVGEAMACGVPCVVTDVGDCRVIVGETGVVVPSRDPRALADGWRSLLRMDDEARRRLGEAARQRVEHYYSLRQIVEQYEQLYLSLVGARSCVD
jgi:glycosyltransferase involved in cell wall biosynthesis